MIYYVDIHAERSGDGSEKRPFRSISEAAMIAAAGDEVIVAPGIYREQVEPRFGGTEEAPIIYRSSEPLGAVITGAETVTDWEKVEDGIWKTTIDNGLFADYNPYTTEVYGDWYFAPSVRHTGAVWLNDHMMYEAESLEECKKGEVYTCSWEPECSVYKWYAVQQENSTVIYANFKELDPNQEKVEINVRRRCFFPKETGKNYITVSGFTIEKAATTWAPPAAFQDGMIGPHWSRGWVIEDCDIWGSKCCGISLGKYYDPENDHYFTRRHIKSPTQMERDAVCRGQYHGWLKEKIGHHTIRRCNIHHCEQTGIVGRMGAVFSTIEDNHIHHINNMQQLGGAEISGIKLHAAIDVLMRRNHIHHCTMGIWCDWEAQGTRITQNLLHDNHRPDFCTWAEGGMRSQDIFVEVGHGPTLIDNNVLLSKASLFIATEGVAMVHNLCLGSFIEVGGGTGDRYTPYHIRHRTEVAGFSTILHGDDRFYNNIFVQYYPLEKDEKTGEEKEHNSRVGTWEFEDYPTYEEWIRHFDLEAKRPNMHEMGQWHMSHLPVWMQGNAYFGGAKNCRHDRNCIVDEMAQIHFELKEENGKTYLVTDLFDHIDQAENGLVNSDILGLAYQPEQRFENRDGTAILFDRDYFGNKRGISTVPGPFAEKDSLKTPLF